MLGKYKLPLLCFTKTKLKVYDGFKINFEKNHPGKVSS